MSDSPDPVVMIDLKFKVAGQPMAARLTVPTNRVQTRVMLPIFQGVDDAVVDLVEKQVAADGKTISCKKGCAACCRQLVPIAQAEAPYLAELIESLPPARAEAIRARFAAARDTLQSAGILAALERPEDFPDSELETMGTRYFGLKIACPFLEDESCSIHPNRPLACREYLVTSPAACCADPTPESVVMVKLPGKVSQALQHLGVSPADRFTKWLPLILALQWNAQHPEAEPEKTGPEILNEVLRQLWGKPSAPASPAVEGS